MTKDCRFLNEEFVILRFEEQVNKRKITKMSGNFSCFKGNLFLFIFTRFFFFLFLCYAISFKISGPWVVQTLDSAIHRINH